jgi:hypothetical protein
MRWQRPQCFARTAGEFKVIRSANVHRPIAAAWTGEFAGNYQPPQCPVVLFQFLYCKLQCAAQF